MEGIMKIISISDLESYLYRQFRSAGLCEQNARTMADVVMRTTLYDRGHHDIHFVPALLDLVLNKRAEANPEFCRLSAFGGMESWDGGNGLGPICCMKAMDRAIELAEQHGIGLCAMRNTNHFMAAGPYVERAARKGYIGIILAKGGVSMGYPGKRGQCMSALPFGFAYPTKEEPVVLDACMAYASMGKLHQMQQEGKSVPSYWGMGPEGKETEDPEELLRGTRFPIGGHKGFGMAMLGEVLTSVLAEGCILDETQTRDGIGNWSAHTAIAVKADALLDIERFQQRTSNLSKRVKELSEGIHIPGEGAAEHVRLHQASGEVRLEEELIAQLNAYAEETGIEGIHGTDPN